MDKLLIGNMFALCASLILACSGLVRDKQRIIFMHCMQKLFGMVGNVILGGITGALMNLTCLIRNIFCYKHRLGIKTKIVLIVISTALVLYSNELSPISFLPMISTIIYTLLMDIKDVIRFKRLALVTTIMWFVYDIFIKSYAGAIFDFAYIITNLITIIRLKRANVKEEAK